MIPLSRHETLQAMLRCGELPTLPCVMRAILEVVESEESSASDLTEIIESDPAISARLLHLANSAFYGVRFEIATVRRAVVVLGFGAVKQLALATGVLDMLRSKRLAGLDPEDYWMHSLGTAKAAQLLAALHPELHSPEGCFMAGLLHDLGKYAMSIAWEDRYQAVVEQARETQVALSRAERRSFGLDHAEAGAWLLEQWGLPPLISTCVRHHEYPGEYAGAFRMEVGIVGLADALSRVAEYGSAGEPGEADVDCPAFQICAPDQETMQAMIDTLYEGRTAARELLHLVLPSAHTQVTT